MSKGRTRIFVLIVSVVLFLLAGILAQIVLYSNKAGKVCASGYNIYSQSGYTSLPKQDEVCPSDKLLKSEIMQKTQRLQMPFIANEGQMDEQVGFYAKTFGGTVFVTKDGKIVYSLPQATVKKDACRTKGTDYASQIENYVYPSLYKSPIIAGLTAYSASKNLQSEFNHQETEIPNLKPKISNLKSTVRGVFLKEELVGGKIHEIKGDVQSVTKVNYFQGKDPTQWKTNISTYDVVSLGEVYEGIGLKLRAYGSNVEKLFYVKPGANPDQIKISLSGIQPPESPLEKGAGGLWVNEHGELVAETELGPVKFTRPVAYQEIDGKRVEVIVEYSIQNSEVKCKKSKLNQKSTIQNPKSEYGFKVASYDKTKDLVIDPLLASTYLGGNGIHLVSGQDWGNSLALDASGNVYVTGWTTSSDFPTTSGAYDTSHNGGNYDVFVSKPDGNLSASAATTPTPSPTPSPTASPKITPSPTITPKVDSLLEKYAPILYMHGQERFHPTNVEVMLDNSELYKQKTGNDKIVYENSDRTLSLDMLMRDKYNTKKHYLKLKKDAEEAAKDNDSYWNWKKEQTVYGRIFTNKDKDGVEKTVIQYWFFYVYNDWGTSIELGNNHQGDWEMIQLVLNKNTEQPEKITFRFHHSGQTFLWNETENVSKEGNHPKVYVTLGGHGCWNKGGSHEWYQEIGTCAKCIDETVDETSSLGDVLYPAKLYSALYHYTLIDISDSNDSKNKKSENHWIYWEGFWGEQIWQKQIRDFGNSGPKSPPDIDYIDDDNFEGRWTEPIKWADDPVPSSYKVCTSDNGKVVVQDLEGHPKSLSDYCNVIYSEEVLVFNVYSLDGKEVDLKISRHKRKGEIYEVEFNSLEIPRNGKASFTFSPEKNPSFEIGIDHDMDGLFDMHKLPDYVEFR